MKATWARELLGDPMSYQRLATEMAATELWSLLMEVTRERARVRTAAELLRQYRRDPFVKPAPIDQRTLVAIDGRLLQAASAFEAVELSPVAPLGTCSAVAITDQHRVLSALRATEVVSDPTNVLALECAQRLAESPETIVRLATSHRVVRAQQVPKQRGFTQHFRLFVLVTGGRETRNHGTLVAAFVEHVRTMYSALRTLEGDGYAFGAIRVDVLTTLERATVGDRIAAELTELRITRKVLEHPYYSGGIRTMMWATDPDGVEVPLVDGGSFDWLGTLSANRRHVFVATGMGAQLVPLRFRTGSP